MSLTVSTCSASPPSSSGYSGMNMAIIGWAEESSFQSRKFSSGTPKKSRSMVFVWVRPSAYTSMSSSSTAKSPAMALL